MSTPRTSAAPGGQSRRVAPPVALRALDELRVGVASALVRAGSGPQGAASMTDAWLLAALAGELLDISGAEESLAAARMGDIEPIARLLARIEATTGLVLGARDAARLPTHPAGQVGLLFGAFAPFRDGDDALGQLGQALRSRALVLDDGEPRTEPCDDRRDEGAYYTPFRIAKRLVSTTLAGFEEVPSVIDPACGAGTFLAAAFDVLHAELRSRLALDPSLPIAPVAWTVAALHGVDINPTAVLAARLSVAVRAVRADRAASGAGQLALFGQAQTWGPLIADRIRLGDALSEKPGDTLPGTERLRRRLLARDEPGRLPSPATPEPVRWDADFPLRFSNDEGSFRAGGFDVVVTNPPFVPIDRIAPEQRARLMKSLATAQRRFDLFIGFVERAHDLLAAGGRGTLLVPRTFLTEANAERCRRLLLEEATIERIEELGPLAFDGARLDCIALTFSAKRALDTGSVAIVRRGERKATQVPLVSFRRAPRGMLRLELAEDAAAESLRLASLGVPLGRYFCASWGARGSPVKDFHLDTPDHPLAKPMLKGEDVEPFVARPQRGRWILYDVEKLYRPSRREFFETEKILIRKVTGVRGLVAAVDASHSYTDDSLACVVRKAALASIPVRDRKRHRISIAPSQIEPSRAYDLHLVCALLQTPLLQEFWRIQLGGGLNVFPELVEALPLPKPAALARPEAIELAAMGRRAAQGEPFDAARADGLARALYGL